MKGSSDSASERSTSRCVVDIMESQLLKELAVRELNQIALKQGFTNPRLDFANAVGKFANFVGKVYRCVVTDAQDQNKRLCLIVKLPPGNAERRMAIRVDEFFKVEAHMYSKVLPALSDCYKKRNLVPVDAAFPCTPRAYSLVVEEEEKLVVLEDLSAKGFIVKDSLAGLDETHCQFVLSNIARLHAASFALQRENPQLHDSLTGKLRENIFFREQMSDNFKRGAHNFRGYIDHRFPLGSPIRNKVESFLDDYQSNMKDLVRCNPTLCCITHGDLWINNLLFKYKEGSAAPEEVCFIDFQISRMSSPVLDLAYFLTLCTNAETLPRYMDLAKYYHGCLCASLSDLGHNPEEIVPWNLLEQQLCKYGRYGWAVAVIVMPLISLDEIDKERLCEIDMHPTMAQTLLEKKSSADRIQQRFVLVLEQSERHGVL